MKVSDMNRIERLCFAVVAVVTLLASPALSEIDFLKTATDFADCMIKYGRDRYGKTHSPLFSNILTREKEPRTTPYPLFPELSDKSKEGWARKLMEWSGPKAGYYYFHKFDFNKILNYPAGLGGEGPHKVTLYGCDPYEDRQLYYMLIDLTRITGQSKRPSVMPGRLYGLALLTEAISLKLLSRIRECSAFSRHECRVS